MSSQKKKGKKKGHKREPSVESTPPPEKRIHLDPAATVPALLQPALQNALLQSANADEAWANSVLLERDSPVNHSNPKTRVWRSAIIVNVQVVLATIIARGISLREIGALVAAYWMHPDDGIKWCMDCKVPFPKQLSLGGRCSSCSVCPGTRDAPCGAQEPGYLPGCVICSNRDNPDAANPHKHRIDNYDGKSCADCGTYICENHGIYCPDCEVYTCYRCMPRYHADPLKCRRPERPTIGTVFFKYDRAIVEAIARGEGIDDGLPWSKRVCMCKTRKECLVCYPRYMWCCFGAASAYSNGHSEGCDAGDEDRYTQLSWAHFMKIGWIPPFEKFTGKAAELLEEWNGIEDDDDDS